MPIENNNTTARSGGMIGRILGFYRRRQDALVLEGLPFDIRKDIGWRV